MCAPYRGAGGEWARGSARMRLAAALAHRFLGSSEQAAAGFLGGFGGHRHGDAVRAIEHDKTFLGSGDAGSAFRLMGCGLFGHPALSLSRLLRVMRPWD